jgi:MFS family permease
MAQRNEIAAVYVAGVIQGLALVTFPAAGTIFTSASDFGLSSTEYGAMFVPQAITAIGSALLGAGLTRSFGAKWVYLLGLGANLSAMTLLIASQFVMHMHLLAFGILLAATACMGVGFGFTVPALNTFAAGFFPQKVDKAVLGLNALLGLGTALAPAFIAIFVGLGIWWGLPLLVSALLVGLLLFSVRLPLDQGAKARAAEAANGKTPIPARFWVFAMFVLLYGICETMNGNWASLYMTQNLGASTTLASFALTVFWATVTAGRILFAAIGRWFPEDRSYRVLPCVVAVALVTVAFIPKRNPFLGILAFGLAGLGCSALLPLTISFGQKELTPIAASVAGGLIAFYQIGYGIGAFGVGPLQNWAGLDLHVIYGGTVLVALVMSALSFAVVRRQNAPALRGRYEPT